MLVGELNGGMETKQERTVSFLFVRFTQQYEALWGGREYARSYANCTPLYCARTCYGQALSLKLLPVPYSPQKGHSNPFNLYISPRFSSKGRLSEWHALL